MGGIFMQHATQYSYTAQQRFGRQVRHGKSRPASAFAVVPPLSALQQPFASRSARGHTYPRSSTSSDLPWIEFRQLAGKAGWSSVSLTVPAGSTSAACAPGCPVCRTLVQIMFLRSSSCVCR
uniref:Uncharacterized protein n=1 Tax=Anopheles merus TaxID=30066 RepID=A0A182UUZ2_ANOME